MQDSGVPRALVVDDDLAIREMAALALEKGGFAVTRASSAAQAIAELRGRLPDLVLTDIYMPGGDGLSVLEFVRALPDPPPVILMTARGTVETAALSARHGAFDYIAKPFDVAVLIERARAATAPREQAAPAPPEEGPASLIVGSHPAIVEVYKAVARVAPTSVPVLVTGETGTGKELVARALHRFSRAPEGPFQPVHCGAIPDPLLESELFGHRKGAFTDAQRDRKGALALADGGTAFLDEAGELSPSFQVKLLRFLEDGLVTPVGAEKGEVVRVRVVSATHRDLALLAAAGTFRQDLYYRLAGYEIRIPPLRERLADLPDLVRHFQLRFEGELGLPAGPPASESVLDRMREYGWPGNVRELSHVVRRLLIDAGRLTDEGAAARLVPIAAPSASPAPGVPAKTGPPPEPSTLDDAERLHVLSVLERSRGNKSEAARILGIERKTLARKLKGWGIEPGAGPEEEAP